MPGSAKKRLSRCYTGCSSTAVNRTMFQIAYIESRGNGPLGEEEARVVGELQRRGIAIQFFTRKQIDRRSLPLDERCFVMGAMPAMLGAMKQLRIEVPMPNDYPHALRDLLHRQVWQSTLGEVEQRIWDDLQQPVFVKPAERIKTFTGRVFENTADLYFLGSASRRQKVWCSQVVKWRSEFRAYVIGTQVVALDPYDGDAQLVPCVQTIAEAVRAFRDSGEAPAAYAIDFGVLADGRTALIETNDGYALGAYRIAAAPYTDLLLTRWAELLGRRRVPGAGA